jgi:hypothetical protein
MLTESNVTGNTRQHGATTQHARKAARYRLLPFMPKLITNYRYNNVTALQQQKCAWQPICTGSFCVILGYGMVYTINWLPEFPKTCCHNLRGRIIHFEEVIGIMGEVGEMSHRGKQWPYFVSRPSGYTTQSLLL